MSLPAATPDRLQVLDALERTHKLFDYRVDGWSAWRVMRNPVRRLAEALPLAAPARSNARRSLQALVATLHLGSLLAFAGRRDLLVKTCRSGLRMPLGKQFRDVYFDGLLQQGHTCLKLEEINSQDFDVQAASAWHPSDLDPAVFTFWGRVLGSLWPVKALPFCESVSGLLAREIQLEIAPRWLLMRLSTVYWQARLFALLLARIQPKAVLVSDTGEYALSIACQRQAVRFVELQHGVFDGAHPDAIPAWVQGSRLELVLPDILASRGSYWIDQLSSTRQGQGQAIAVGNELIDLARLRRHARHDDGLFRLVLTTQGLDSQRLAQWINAMIATAPNSLCWRLAIKLHPVYDAQTQDYDSLKADSRIQVIAGADQPNVFDLLADADLHLSIASACHFDAAALEVPTVVLPLSGHEAMLRAVDGAQIFLAHQPADIWAFSTNPTGPAPKINRFATPGFIDNLQRLIA